MNEKTNEMDKEAKRMTIAQQHEGGMLLCAVCNKPLMNEHKIVCFTYICKNPHCAANVMQSFTLNMGRA